MDFVISKVAMSLCALIVASVLGPILVSVNDDGDRVELDAFVTNLSRAISMAVVAGLETNCELSLPTTSSGDEVHLELRPGGLLISSEDERVVCRPCTKLHLWKWNGSALTSTEVERLDSTHRESVAVSGDTIIAATRWIPVDSTPTLLAFVWTTKPYNAQSFAEMSSTASASAWTSSIVL